MDPNDINKFYVEHIAISWKKKNPTYDTIGDLLHSTIRSGSCVMKGNTDFMFYGVDEAERNAFKKLLEDNRIEYAFWTNDRDDGLEVETLCIGWAWCPGTKPADSVLDRMASETIHSGEYERLDSMDLAFYNVPLEELEAFMKVLDENDYHYYSTCHHVRVVECPGCHCIFEMTKDAWLANDGKCPYCSTELA